MNLQQMKVRMGELLKRLAEIQKLDTRTDDDETEIDRLLNEVNDLGPKITREQTIADTAARSAEFNAPKPGGHNPLDQVAEDGKGKRAKRETLSPGGIVVEHPFFAEYRSNPSGKSGRIPWQQIADERLARASEDGAPEQRTLVYTGGFTSFIVSDRMPGLESFVRKQLRVRDLFPNVPVTTTGFEFVRSLAGTNAAVEVAEPTTVAGATEKPESAINLEVVTGSTATIASWVPVTRQMLDDVGQIQAIIENELLVFLEERIDDELLNGNGVGANITGLLATSGIQDLSAAYFGGADVTDTGTNNQNINRIRRAIRTIATSSSGRGTANFVVLNPADAEEFDTYTDADRQYLFGGPQSGAGVRTLWGLRVVESESIAANTALVGDSRGARVMTRRDGQIFMSDSHSDYFTKNLVAILAEARIGLAVTRPSVFAKVALA